MGIISLALALAAVYYTWTYLNKPKKNLPPGPKPLPIVGNILNLVARELWLPASKWAQEYGGIVYIHVFGQSLVFLNDYEVALELLEKRGAIYSDRPGFVMAGELCGCNNMVAFARYGDQTRRHRRLMQQALGISSIRRYEPLLEVEVKDLLKRMLVSPEDYTGNIQRYAGSMTLNTVYGYHVQSNEDKYIKMADEVVNILANDISSGGGIWPVDIIPALQYLPDWFPGSAFKRKAATWKAKLENFVDRPYEWVKERMRDGTAVPSFCSTLLEDLQERCEKEADPQRESDIKWTANSIYASSIDTMLTTVDHFILAMILHPEKLVKAQEEMDRVVGSGRLPTFADRPSLPYLEAIMNESLRWGAPVPLSLPHRLMEDDVYNGMFIPKGSLVFGNVWTMIRDPKLFPNPEEFLPERYLETVDEHTARRRDPRNYVFGFGRRRCPGNHLAESSLWIVMASMVATLDMKKAVDAQGNVIEPTISFENSVFRTPSPFKCDIRPRSEQALRLVRQATEA
ncbi:cytochrome P450 [Laetiporus sulphureus 93-53]|uniref:Cytochrome P450 n=1 Tax=Laetiporus sulphureus 93-53 TaxID=1314785 RepID=A0A165CWZ6_9APHY|nr:cytochrome P450 [Laetiporus sulphureus 93-53]KZT03623.1 cytochrome P450 [Laetiporus sulphureus 93-53]